MRFEPNRIYHLMNRGNNRQRLFLSEDHYLFFLRKIKTEIVPFANIICYCLMPNHFHILLCPKENGCRPMKKSSEHSIVDMQVLTRKIGTLQSSYTRALNNQMGWTGSLFKSKAQIRDGWQDGFRFGPDNNYAFICFNYIHQNPVKAGLVLQPEDWPYSSAREYATSTPQVCNQNMAKEILNFL